MSGSHGIRLLGVSVRSSRSDSMRPTIESGKEYGRVVFTTITSARKLLFCLFRPRVAASYPYVLRLLPAETL